MLLFQQSNSIENYTYNSYIYDPCELEYHFHKNYELIYVMDGEINADIDGNEFKIKKGEFSLILPYKIHSLHTPSGAKVWIGVFSSDFVKSFDDFINGKANKKITFRTDDIASAYIQRLFTAEQPDIFTIQSVLYAICSAYVKDGIFYAKTNEDKDLPIKIYNYIENNFTKDISLKKISAELGYDYHYLSRVYHSVFHSNFRNILNQFRADYALKLFRTKLSIAEVAMGSGFGSIRTMNRYFKATYNKTPTQIIKENHLNYSEIKQNTEIHNLS